MRKLTYIFSIIFFLSLGGQVFASGVTGRPQSVSAPSSAPSLENYDRTHLEIPQKELLNVPKPDSMDFPVEIHPQDLFKESLEPIIKAKKPVVLDTEKKMEGATFTDVQLYEKISLPEAINYALSHNLDIKGNRINEDIARNDIKKAGKFLNPYFLSYFNTGRAATDNPDYVGLVFPIELFKRGPRKNLAKSNLELTKGNIAFAEFNLRLDVRQAYVDLVAAKTTLKILNDHRLLLQELLDVAQRKYDVGASPNMDVIHAKMTLNQLLIQVNNANTDVYTARYNFNRVLNSRCYDTKEDYLPENQEVIFLLTPKPAEELPSFNDLLNVAFEKRLDLKNAQKAVDVAQKNLVTVVRQRVPDIELGAGGMLVPSQFATDDKNSTGLYFMGNITNIPLFYRYTPEIKNAKLQIEQKQLAYNSLKNKAILDLHTSYDEFNTAKDNLNYYSDVLLSESKQFLDMAKRSYKVGKSSITDFIFIQQSYKTIMMGYTSALQYYYNSWVNIVREINDEELKLHG